MPRIRLQDVAKHAGVSMKTVSNVVHAHPHVSPGMRERVQLAIDELGYRPNAIGRRLATGRSGLLALALPDVRIPYFAELANAVSAAASSRGYRVLLEQTGGSLEEERAIVSSSEAGLVDGVILQPSAMSVLELAQHRDDVPVVLLGEGSAPVTMDHLMVDNIAAATAVTRHLAALGRRRIAFLGHEAGGPSATSRQRLIGYQQGLELSGLAADTALLLATRSVSVAAAADALAAALDSGLRIDAVVCRDDLAAIGALRALHERALAVPGDVAVTGWDDIAMSAFTSPSLTTVAADMESLAEGALDLLTERIDGYEGLGRHQRVGFELKVRESAPLA